MYDKNTVYIVGNSRTNTDNAITQNFISFFLGFVVERDSGEIVDLSCSSTIRTTEEFIASLFMGKSLKSFDEAMENEIRNRYFGSSQKAIIVAYKDAVKKFNEIPR
jgi:flavin-binding protein dodecin